MSPRAPEICSLQISAVERLLARAPDREPLLARWLTPDERAKHRAFRFDKRRREWLAGRLAAKHLIRKRHRLSGYEVFERIEILAGADGRPGYRIDGRSGGELCLSISHSGDLAVAALPANASELVGVDVEHLVLGGPGFESLLLDPEERERIRDLQGAVRRRALTRLWVLKEAFTKALGVGLGVPLPSVRVERDEPPRLALGFDRISSAAGALEFRGCWIGWVVLS